MSLISLSLYTLTVHDSDEALYLEARYLFRLDDRPNAGLSRRSALLPLWNSYPLSHHFHRRDCSDGHESHVLQERRMSSRR